MSWFKIDDGFSDHPKVLVLQKTRHWKGALALWTLAGAWSSKQMTDGFIPVGIVSRLGGTSAECQSLVSAGLWVAAPDGYRFHGWLEHNPSRAETEEKRRKNREKVASHREKERDAKAQKLDCNQGSNRLPSEPVTLSRPVPSRPLPSEEREPKALTLVRGDRIDGQPLGDWLREGVAKGYQSLKLPAPKETRSLTWGGWRDLEAWVVEKDRLTARGDQRETGRHLIRCFLRSPRAAKLGHPITFLVANANEYWRDDLPPALEAAS